MTLTTVPDEDREVMESLRSELIQTRLLLAQLLAIQTGEPVRVALPIRP